jgi:hypothetical protein
VTLGKVFVECAIKSTRQRSRCPCAVRRAFFAECFLDVAECFRHSTMQLFQAVSAIEDLLKNKGIYLYVRSNE